MFKNIVNKFKNKPKKNLEVANSINGTKTDEFRNLILKSLLKFPFMLLILSAILASFVPAFLTTLAAANILSKGVELYFIGTLAALPLSYYYYRNKKEKILKNLIEQGANISTESLDEAEILNETKEEKYSKTKRKENNDYFAIKGLNGELYVAKESLETLNGKEPILHTNNEYNSKKTFLPRIFKRKTYKYNFSLLDESKTNEFFEQHPEVKAKVLYKKI